MIPQVPRYDHDMTGEEIRALVGDAPFILELGSNDGISTAMFLRAMPKATVACFEFQQSALEDFRARNFDGRVTLHPVALSDRYGPLSTWESGGITDCNNPKKPWNKSSSTVRPLEHLAVSPEITFTPGPQVPGYPLDHFYADLPLPVDFLWCDVQGSEARVILGGQRVLRQTKYAKFEFYDRELYERQADLRGLLSFLPDFDLVAIYEHNALFKNRSFT